MHDTAPSPGPRRASGRPAAAAWGRLPRRARRRAVAATAAMALLLGGVGAASAATQVTVKNPGGLTAVGPVNGENGFPTWYGDSNNLRVEMCLDGGNPLCGFLPGDIPDENAPISFPDNFPEEVFYMLAGSELDLPGGGRAVLTLGLEAAFANTVTQGDQQVFARQRIVVKGAPASTTLTFKHPYGTVTIDTDGSGAGRLVEDISPSVGNFATPLKGNIGPFLKWDSGAPEGYLGNPDVPHTVTGGPLGNSFSVTGGGLDLTNNEFTVQGKIATNSGLDAVAAVPSGGQLDVFATSGDGAVLQVEGESGKYETTPMRSDPASGRFYARLDVTGAMPARVKVVNLTDKPASSKLVDVTTIKVTQAEYDGTDLTVAATSAATEAALHVVGLTPGTLTAGTPTSFPMAAPPATVTVANAAGATASLPVTVTGGAATGAALPPVPPQPDPGPVTDNTPNNPGTGTPPAAAPVAVASASTTSVTPGIATTLDGSGSTGATAYEWSQVSGTPVAFSDKTVAKPTVTLPFPVATTATSPVTVPAAGPVVLRLTVTGAGGVTSTADVTLNTVYDSVAVDANSRHRVGTELRVNGTATLAGSTGILNPQTQVVIFDTTPGRAVRKLGTSPVDTLGAWSLRLKPAPAPQVTRVLVQSTRGGQATGTLLTR